MEVLDPNLQRAVVVAVSVPNATEVMLLLDDLEGDAPLQHALGSYNTHHSTANDGDIDVLSRDYLDQLRCHHLDVYFFDSLDWGRCRWLMIYYILSCMYGLREGPSLV